MPLNTNDRFLLVMDDILDWAAFCLRLANSGAGIAGPDKRIMELLPAEVSNALLAAGPAGLIEDGEKAKLVAALNEIIKRPDFYQEEDFKGLIIPERVEKLLTARQDLLKANPERVNRLLLERAYPTEIKCIFEPYAGPRSFLREQQDFFFGRSQETDALVSLITAHPVVLFYSQSGAGKTSLLNASLLPTLEEDENFNVMGPMRVQGQVAAGARVAKKANLYLLNALMSCRQENGSQSKIAGQTLAEFLKERGKRLNQYGEPCPTVIVFDQFEELFTFNPGRWEDRDKFFEQVRDALEGNPKLGIQGDPLLRVIFSMREDYIAEMDPYASILPEKLKTRFRLEHLRRDPALLAITEPLAGTGRSYAPTVAEKLVDNLLRIPNQNSGESPKSGIYVEPLQLQIVCQSLWKALKPNEPLITQKHLKKYGDVSQALFYFYEDSIRTVSKETGITEEVLRTWFGDTLITSDGVRAPVYRREFETGGLSNAAVDKLEEIRLIKAESRGINVRWYELAHDRFIEPIRKSNDKWLDEQSRADKSRRRLTIRAAKWSQGTGSLLEGYELTEAKRLIKHWNLPKDSPLLAFVDASGASVQHATVKLYGVVALALLGLVLLMAGVALYTWKQGDAAKKAAGIAKSQVIATKAGMYLETDPELSVLLTQKALADFHPTEESEEVLHKGMLALSDIRGTLRPDKGRMKNAVFSPDGNLILTTSDDGIARLWNAQTKKLVTELGIKGQALFATYSPKGKLIVTVGNDGIGRLWDGSTGHYLRDLQGYANSGSQAAFCPDEERIVAETDDNRVGIWNASTGELTKPPLSGHTDRIHEIVITRDGARFATEAIDGTARIWDLGGVRPPITLLGLSGLKPAIAFSPDGKLLASEGALNTEMGADQSSFYPVTVWNAMTGAEKFRLQAHTDTITSIAFSPDGNSIVTTSNDGTAQVWDANDGRSKIQLRPVADKNSQLKAILRAAFSPDSKLIATAGADNTARIWNLAGQTLATLRGHSGAVNSALFGSDGSLVITASDDMTARIWQWNGAKDTYLKAHPKGVNSAVFSLDGKRVVTAGFDGTARLWETNPLSLAAQLEGHSDRIVNIAISPDGKSLVTSSFDNTARVWSLDPSEQLSYVKGQLYKGQIVNGGFVATAVLDNSSRLWRAPTSQPPSHGRMIPSFRFMYADRELKGHTDHVNKAAFSPDNKVIVTASSDGTVRVWNASTGESIREIDGRSGKLHSVAFSPDGKSIITTGDDLSVRIWDAANYTFIKTLGQHAKAVFSADYSPDGTLVVTASADGIARVWNAKTGERVAELKGHYDEVNSASFSPNGKLLVTSSDDQTIRVWDATTWQRIAVLHGHTGKVYGAAFSPDGNSIVTASADGTSHIYPALAFAPTSEVQKLIPERVFFRTLSDRELKQFFDPLNR